MSVLKPSGLSRQLCFLSCVIRAGAWPSLPRQKFFRLDLKQAKKQKTGSALNTPWTGPVSLDVLHCTGAPRLRMSYSVCVFFSR